MAAKQGGDRRRDSGAKGLDDIERGNTGTADQGPGDVHPGEKVDARTGEIERHPFGRKPVRKS